MPRVASLLGSLLLAFGCGGEAAAEGGHGDAPPAQVEVAHGRVGGLPIVRTYLGLTRASARAALAAGAEAEVLEVTVREGDRVEAGQLLVRLNPGLARADVQAAQASAQRTETERAQAIRDAERFERAGVRTVAASEIERAAAQARALGAQSQTAGAQLARARASLDRHRVIAPFAGVVSARHVDPGDWVSPGAPVLELVSDDAVEILVRVEPELLDDVAVGTLATVSRGERSTPAEVTGVVRALDPITRTAQLRLLPTAVPWLLPGAAADVRFELLHEGEGLVVPRDALVDGVAQARVVKVVEGQAQPVVVEVLERGRDEVRVRAEGLTEADLLVVRGNDRLRADQPVTVVTP
jgi:RND family efflux transporter MFP subunit